MNTVHQPVLLAEVLNYLQPQPGKNFIDCTFGGGGHSLALLEKITPGGKLIGIDWDPDAVQDSHNRNLILVNDNYKNLKKIIKKVKDDSGLDQINGILLDLGLSSDQLDRKDRGFSFQSEEPLDLRFNQKEQTLTAAEILRTESEQKLFEIFKKYGEEPLARAIAKKIIADRQNGLIPETAAMLVQLVSGIYRRHFKDYSRRNPATRVFQALRIAVNDEFGNIENVLPQAIDVLTPGGRLAVISFHSGEDRIVKSFFKDLAAGDNPRIKIITKKPVVAQEAEVESNPRSRSAKMRVIEKIN